MPVVEVTGSRFAPWVREAAHAPLCWVATLGTLAAITGAFLEASTDDEDYQLAGRVTIIIGVALAGLGCCGQLIKPHLGPDRGCQPFGPSYHNL